MKEPFTLRRGASVFPDAVWVFLFGIVYLGALLLGDVLDFPPEGISTFWPGSGLLMAALLLTSPRQWAGLLFLAVIANVVSEAVVLGHSAWQGLMFGIGNGLEGTVGAWLLRRYLKAPPALQSVRDVLALTLFGMIVSVGLSALIGATVLSVQGFRFPFSFILQAWWLADALGVLIVVPVILSWASAVQRGFQRAAPSRVVEGVALFAALIVVGQLVFGAEPAPAASMLDFPYVIYPILLWAVLRFDLRVVTAALMVTAFMVVLNANLGRSPFVVAGQSVREQVLAIQAFLAVTTLSTLIVAAMVHERREAVAMQERLIAELETKNAELERFTYTVSHDLKSPLFTIQGFIGLLEQDVAEGNLERARQDIERIRGAAHTMQRLLSELLELSRIGRIANEPEPVPLAEVAREAVELMAGRIREAGVDVRIAPNMPVVQGDRVRLREVYQNLVENAVKFMGDQPEPRIEIDAWQKGTEVISCVRDNGVGIEPQYHEKIFGLFERLSKRQDGTGIGLALVKRIVEVHGGRIWVESEGAGKGSAFCFILPREGKPTHGLPPQAA
jgi:signal transduction histidine kinase